MVYIVGCSWFVMRASPRPSPGHLISSFGGSEVSKALARLGTFEVAPQRSARIIRCWQDTYERPSYNDITKRQALL
jgi:hypothetical protein